MHAEEIFEPRHDRLVVAKAAVRFETFAAGQAPDHRLGQRLFERPGRLGMRQNFGRAGGQSSRGQMQPPQSRQKVGRRPHAMGVQGRRQYTTEQGIRGFREVIRGEGH
jgi:hypothetical protein